MLHLPIERFAELVDGGMIPAEREHLATCGSCSKELVAYRRLVELAADERRRIAPPLTGWDGLSTELRRAGLIREGDAIRSAVSARPGKMNLLLFARRAAAIVVLVGGGAILGRLTAGLGVMDAVAFRSAPSMRGDGTILSDSTGLGGEELLASNGGGAFTSTQDALAQLDRAQRAYTMAASYLATHDTSTSSEATDQYRTRLAALDLIAGTIQPALRDAPQDAVLNQYYLATLGAREQTLRRLGTALPVGNRLTKF